MARGEGGIIRRYWTSSLFLGGVVLFLWDDFLGDVNLLLEVDR